MRLTRAVRDIKAWGVLLARVTSDWSTTMGCWDARRWAAGTRRAIGARQWAAGARILMGCWGVHAAGHRLWATGAHGYRLLTHAMCKSRMRIFGTRPVSHALTIASQWFCGDGIVYL